ncbi:hypothetical protein [Gymnodinialimonas hymeniacidonis]|uniref:hypothetical protein n=1 Tax=Gymnodinialimonas hymeniacidonis TaxID=3126508 RepID=UPI0034C5DBF1
MRVGVVALALTAMASQSHAQDYDTFRTCVIGPSGEACSDIVLGCAYDYDWTDTGSAEGLACFTEERAISDTYFARSFAELDAEGRAEIAAVMAEREQSCNAFYATVPAADRAVAEVLCQASNARRLAILATGLTDEDE